MTTPYDPDRPEDRPQDQPGYPPPQQYPQGQQYPQAPPPGGYAGGPPAGGYPPAPQYGGAPQYGDPYGGAPRAPVAPPKEVVWATQLMFLRVAIGILSAIVAFASGDSIKDSIREANPNFTQDQIDSAYNLAVGLAIFFGLVFAVLYILLAIQVRKGKNWARIVTWVLASLGVLSGLLGLAGPGTGLDKLISVLLLVVDAGIIVLLLLRPSNEYFAAQKAPRY